VPSPSRRTARCRRHGRLALPVPGARRMSTPLRARPDPSMRTRSPPSADVSHLSQIPGRSIEIERDNRPDVALCRPMMAPHLAPTTGRAPMADP
jgi:hypothetical protein